MEWVVNFILRLSLPPGILLVWKLYLKKNINSNLGAKYMKAVCHHMEMLSIYTEYVYEARQVTTKSNYMAYRGRSGELIYPAGIVLQPVLSQV